MSDTDSNQAKPSQGTSASQPTDSSKSSCSKGAYCKPHSALVISIAALALAGYAAFNTNNTQDNRAISAQLTSMDSRIANINQQLELLSAEMQSNRDNLLQSKLKNALDSIRDIGDIAEKNTKQAVSEIESMLQSLTDIGASLSIPSLYNEEDSAATEAAKTVGTEEETAAETVTPDNTNTATEDAIKPATTASPAETEESSVDMTAPASAEKETVVSQPTQEQTVESNALRNQATASETEDSKAATLPENEGAEPQAF